jgi:peptide/nickel transport system permease protein
LLFSSAILMEATLAYLGAGAQRPVTSWGRMFYEAQSVAGVAPTLVIFPGIFMILAVLGFNLLGDGLRAVLDPHQTSRTGV